MSDKPDSAQQKELIVLVGGNGKSHALRELTRTLLDEAGVKCHVIEPKADQEIALCSDELRFELPEESEEIDKPKKPVEPWRVKKGRRQRGGYPRYR